MTNEPEQNVKAKYADCATQAQTPGAAIGGYADLDGPCWLSLAEHVSSQLHHARRESRKAERLGELQYLLEKHPEVARILDLMEDLRY